MSSIRYSLKAHQEYHHSFCIFGIELFNFLLSSTNDKILAVLWVGLNYDFVLTACRFHSESRNIMMNYELMSEQIISHS
ncbi:hypothetical protein HanIR_Chr17g0871431 [Helianthus annuus]|nr:hypothetical protein HanIR_Chr17g0871431 [Helianthus annuus]